MQSGLARRYYNIKIYLDIIFMIVDLELLRQALTMLTNDEGFSLSDRGVSAQCAERVSHGTVIQSNKSLQRKNLLGPVDQTFLY